MYMPRLATLLGFFLLLSGSQGLVLVDRADAGCCNIYTGCKPTCGCWSSVLYGYIEVQEPQTLVPGSKGKAKVYTDKSNKVEVELTDEIWNLLKTLKQDHGKNKAFGWIVLTGNGMAKLICKDFIAAHEEGDQEYEKPLDAGEATKKSNEKWEKVNPKKSGSS